MGYKMDEGYWQISRLNASAARGAFIKAVEAGGKSKDEALKMISVMKMKQRNVAKKPVRTNGIR